MFSMLRKDSRGFTLVELMMVIVILGVLAGVAVPLIGNMRTTAVENKAKSIADSIVTAVSMDGVKNGTYPLTAAAVTALLTLPSDVEIVANVAARDALLATENLAFTYTATATTYTLTAYKRIAPAVEAASWSAVTAADRSAANL